MIDTKKTQQLIDAIPSIVWMCHPDGAADYFNLKWYEQFGQTPAEAVGWGWIDVIHPEDLEQFQIEWKRTISSGSEYETEVRFKMASGEHRCHLVQASPIQNELRKIEQWFVLCTDIHKKHQAVKDFQSAKVADANERRISAAIETMDDSIFLTNTNSKIESWNRGAERMYGYSPCEAIGESLEMLLPDELRHEREAIFDRLQRGELVDHFETVRLTKSGQRIHVLLSISAVKDSNGQITHYLSVQNDITERVQMRLELEREQAVLQAIVNGLPDAVLLGDLDRNLTYCNPSATRMFGYTSCELIGKPGLNLLANNKDKEHFAAEIFHPDVPKNFHTLEAEWLRKTGESFVGEMVGTLIQDESGSTIGYLALLRDITDRKQSELALRNRERHYRTVVETAGSVIMIMSIENTILEWNFEAERLLGYSREEVIGKNPFEFLIDFDRHDETKAEINKILTGSSLRSFKLPFRSRDGSQHLLLWNAKRMFDGNDQLIGYIAIGQDISELKVAQNKLIQSERLAAMGQMISSIAHESRNALQRIQAAVDLLKFEIQENSEAASDLAEIAHARSDLLTLLDGMRDYAAPVVLKLQDCKVSDVWQQAWRHLSGLRKNRQAQLVEQTKGVNLRCTVDAFRIEQVFRNLIENALAACNDPIEITIACEDCDVESVPCMRISVRDNGPGLTPEQQNRIFEAFYTTKPKGTGLGMAIASKNLVAHNGTLVAGNGENDGAEFVVTIPRNLKVM